MEIYPVKEMILFVTFVAHLLFGTFAGDVLEHVQTCWFEETGATAFNAWCNGVLVRLG